jgi:hypothetical protein
MSPKRGGSAAVEVVIERSIFMASLQAPAVRRLVAQAEQLPLSRELPRPAGFERPASS